MAHVAIIPARGGSKRLPGKNVRKLGDKPLIAWTIQAALASDCFDYVLVSTDDEDIAKTAQDFGAKAPFLRPPKISGDEATSDSVIEHAIEWLEQVCGYEIETVTLLQPTSPFRTARHIRECAELYRNKDADAVVSVGEVNVHLEICNTLPPNNSLSGFLKSNGGRTQQMEPQYQLNGAIYMFSRTFVGNLLDIYAPTSRSFAYIMNREDSIDIDVELDFLFAEFIFSYRSGALKQ